MGYIISALCPNKNCFALSIKANSKDNALQSKVKKYYVVMILYEINYKYGMVIK